MITQISRPNLVTSTLSGSDASGQVSGDPSFVSNCSRNVGGPMVVEWRTSLALPVIPGFTTSGSRGDVTCSELLNSADAPTLTVICSPCCGR